MAEQLSWEAWQEKANAAYVKGQYGAQQMIADWGYPAGMTSEGYKIEFDKGKVKRKNREGRRAQRARANSLRALRAQTKGELEAADLTAKTREARTQSQSTLHRQTYGNKPSIVEHDVALQAGGSNTYTSISDPEFKQHKDDVEAAAYRRFGKDKVIVDIDDVSGDVRLIPAQYHNKFQATSQQPGIDVPMGADIDKALNTFESTKFKPTRLVDDLNLTPAETRSLNKAPTIEAKDALLTKIKAARLVRNAAPVALSIPAGIAASTMSAQAAIQDPSQDNLVNAGFDIGNTLADLVGLIPTPLTVGLSEGAQRSLMIGQMGYNAMRQSQKQQNN